MKGEISVNKHSDAERRPYQFRRATEGLAGAGLVVCTAVTVFFLFMILGYVVYNGASAIDWNFLTGLPLPSGESGGGIANALVGSVLVVACGGLLSVAIGPGAAIFRTQFPRAPL